MDHFAGLDVSVKETSICIVDDTGRIVREVKVASEPEASQQSRFDHSWDVFVEWSQGKTEYVRGFPTKQAADKWIAEESAAWLKTPQIE